MRATPGRISVTYLAYVMLLFGFISLGVLVGSLAVGGTGVARLAGVALVGSLAASVVGFRVAARTFKAERGSDAHNVSIFDRPRDAEAADRYAQRYRAVETGTGSGAGRGVAGPDVETPAPRERRAA